MAVTSLWRITGRLDKVLNYAENPEKTEKPEGLYSNSLNLDTVIDYAIRANKTGKIRVDDEGQEIKTQFVTGIECSPDIALSDMMAVKKRFQKTGGTVAYHGYQSFGPGEATPEIAHEIGVKLAQRLWGDRYQVVIATHLDKENHLHSHFVINTVSYVDGKKFFRSEKDYQEMRRVSDELCREYGLSVIRQPDAKRQPYAVWKAEQEGRPTQRSIIKGDIDRAIQVSFSDKAFVREMEKMGYTMKFYGSSGQPLVHPALKPPGGSRFFRFDSLGEDYSADAIYERILHKKKRELPFPPEEQQEVRQYRQQTQPIYHRHVTGLRGLYLRYCYELRIIQKHPASVRVLPYSMREDMIKLDRFDREVRLLAKYKIETGSELMAHRKEVEEKLADFGEKRKLLRNELRRATRNGDEPKAHELKETISRVSAEMKKLREEVRLCDDIAQRSGRVRANLEHHIETTRKERSRDELRIG